MVGWAARRYSALTERLVGVATLVGPRRLLAALPRADVLHGVCWRVQGPGHVAASRSLEHIKPTGLGAGRIAAW